MKKNEQHSIEPVIQGFDEKVSADRGASKLWHPVSDRKVRVGIAGYGACKFGAVFYFQNHPNIKVAAVSDPDPVRCDMLAKDCFCDTKYKSCEEMIQDKTLDAVFIATDAPSHARLAIAALKAGKHVASAVPAVWGSLEDAEALFQTVNETGLKYMLFETSAFREDVFLAREMFKAGRLGKLIYSEGEYWHYFPTPFDSYGGWRTGLPPQWYPTHSNAFYICVTDGSFTDVSCMAIPSSIDQFKPENNPYKNPFGTEIALFRTSEGGTSRMVVAWDTPGVHGEVGRIYGEKGSMNRLYPNGIFQSDEKNAKQPEFQMPLLPPGVDPGAHGGSHGYLTNEFVESILMDRRPLVDIVQALNLTVPGIIAHQSALNGGALMKIPQFSRSVLVKK